MLCSRSGFCRHYDRQELIGGKPQFVFRRKPAQLIPFRRTRIVLVSAAMFYMVISAVSAASVLAQDLTPAGERLATAESALRDHGRRIDGLEQMKIEARMTKLETYAESNQRMLYGMFFPLLAIGLDVLSRLAGWFQQKRRA
jgi:hypothetical protein